MSWNINIVLVFICVFLNTCQCFLWHLANRTTTPIPLDLNTTTAAQLPGNNEEEFDPVKAEAGAIAGAVFGITVCLVVIGVSGIIYLKRKREQDLEYHRKTKVLQQSSQSAGVYMDTTLQDPAMGTIRSTNNRGQAYKSLNRDPNMYESDSEDEL